MGEGPTPLPQNTMFTFTFIDPPNTNHKYISGKFILTKRYRNFLETHRQALSLICKRHIEGEVAVYIKWYRKQRRGDIDGVIKPILDCMNKYVYLDDKQVVELHIARYEDKNNPRAEVTVEEVW